MGQLYEKEGFRLSHVQQAFCNMEAYYFNGNEGIEFVPIICNLYVPRDNVLRRWSILMEGRMLKHNQCPVCYADCIRSVNYLGQWVYSPILNEWQSHQQCLAMANKSAPNVDHWEVTVGTVIRKEHEIASSQLWQRLNRTHVFADEFIFFSPPRVWLQQNGNERLKKKKIDYNISC